MPCRSVVGIELDRYAIDFKRSIDSFGIWEVVPSFDVVSISCGESLDMLERRYRKFVGLFLPA